MKTRIAFNLLPINCSAMLQSPLREKAFYPFRNLDSQRLLLGRPLGRKIINIPIYMKKQLTVTVSNCKSYRH